MPKGLKNIQISFVENNLTHFGGLYLIHTFCKKLKLKQYLQMHVKFRPKNQKYQTAEFVLILIYIIILGIRRIENSRFLQTNGVFKKVIGLKRVPDPTAIRRFLYQLSPSAIRQIVKVHNLIQKKIFVALHKKTSIILDIDGTVLTVFGQQEKSKVGYNPKRRGARSYLAMLCFESDREFWYGTLYSGNIAQAKIAKHIIKKCLDKLPYPIYRIRIRADAIFYSGNFIENFLETENIGYAINIPLRPKLPILTYIEQAFYTAYKNNYEAAEFQYQPITWAHSHRFIVKRHPLPDDPDEKLQLKLFEMKNYGYRVLITDLPLQPGRVWDFYSQRSQGAELNIKELKLNYSLAKIPTKKWTANVVYLQLNLFAFNIINWFKILCLPENYHHVNLQTVRDQLLLVPARLIKTDNKNILNFPAGHQYKDLFNIAIKNINNLKKL